MLCVYDMYVYCMCVINVSILFVFMYGVACYVILRMYVMLCMNALNVCYARTYDTHALYVFYACALCMCVCYVCMYGVSVMYARV